MRTPHVAGTDNPMYMRRCGGICKRAGPVGPAPRGRGGRPAPRSKPPGTIPRNRARADFNRLINSASKPARNNAGRRAGERDGARTRRPTSKNEARRRRPTAGAAAGRNNAAGAGEARGRHRFARSQGWPYGGPTSQGFQTCRSSVYRSARYSTHICAASAALQSSPMHQALPE